MINSGGDFCRMCGASIPPIHDEGSCDYCTMGWDELLELLDDEDEVHLKVDEIARTVIREMISKLRRDR